MKDQTPDLEVVGDGDIVVLGHGEYGFEGLTKDMGRCLGMDVLAQWLAITNLEYDENLGSNVADEVLPKGYSGKIILWACSAAGDAGAAKALHRELQEWGYKCPVWGCKWVTASITPKGVFRCCRGWLAGTEKDRKKAEENYPTVDCTMADMVQYGGSTG
jgi:hypothetical protein